ncbi:MAG: tRNA (N(6)-L-threonylcarbamoyladenosine(37)-C(2))-methylthiotransferase MtaB [Acidobacteria bacterium]|nr:tRNA (N(6)-L-threonylcarbamoyladenosine(37)-C(2))-methylthiotransferase MtaB [Acidobacteriota bacterium]
MSKFFVCTFGCRCNQADSDAIRESFCRRSMSEAETHLDAELVVVNSCTVTQRTDRQVRQMVRRIHRENPKARLVVTGCYAERDPQALAAMGGVSLVVGNAERERLQELIQNGACGATASIIRSPFSGGMAFLPPSAPATGGKTRPLIKLQDGCDARCSYCIVPFVRGPARSAHPDAVIAGIERLVGAGYREIVLTGVNLGSYGRKLDGFPTLLDLLRRVLSVPGPGRLRLSSIEPMRFSRGVARLAAEDPRLPPHFHIPLQSGSDRILRRMRRPYTADRFLDLAGYIREILPDAGIGSDVMVGFPGERDDDFDKTFELVQRSPLTYLHVFPFSARDGTAAAAMTEHVPEVVVRERVRIMRELSQAKNLEFRRRFVGRSLPGITLAKEEGVGDAVVLTENYIAARVPKPVEPNRLVTVRIIEAHPDYTRAEIQLG